MLSAEHQRPGQLTLEGRLLRLVLSTINVGEGGLEALSVSLATEESAASLGD